MMQDRIREGLLRKAGLTEQQISDVLQSERETGQTLDQVLVNRNMMPERQCLEFFGDFLGLEVLPSLEGVSVPSDFIQNIPVQFARTHGLIALDERNRLLRVATARPLDVHQESHRLHRGLQKAQRGLRCIEV